MSVATPEHWPEFVERIIHNWTLEWEATVNKTAELRVMQALIRDGVPRAELLAA
jgi:hypothetical protein